MHWRHTKLETYDSNNPSRDEQQQNCNKTQTTAMRCLLNAFRPSYIPFVSLTATATDKVQKFVMKSLALAKAFTIIEFPDRPNIKYVVIKTSSKPFTSPSSFMWLILKLKDLKEATPRTIIFCSSHVQFTSLYVIFEEALGRSCKLFAIYHGSTDSDIQREVVEDFVNADDKIRILFV